MSQPSSVASSPQLFARASPNASMPGSPGITGQYNFCAECHALMISRQYEQLLDLAETHEMLDGGGVSVDSELYFLLQTILPFLVNGSELTSVRYSWKRASLGGQRKRFPILTTVFTELLLPLYQKDFAKFFSQYVCTVQSVQALVAQSQASPAQSPLLSLLLPLLDTLYFHTRQSVLATVENIYETIAADQLMAMTGLSSGDVDSVCPQRGWQRVDNRYWRTRRTVDSVSAGPSATASNQLRSLTEYVLTLEQ